MPAQSVHLSATVVPACHQAVWATAARATAATGAAFATGNELPSGWKKKNGSGWLDRC